MIKIKKRTEDSITITLFDISDRQQYYSNPQQRIYCHNIPKNASSFIQRAMYHFENFDNSKKNFAIIREPKQRLISALNYDNFFDDHTAVEFIESWKNKKTDKLKIMLAKISEINFIPQHVYINNCPLNWPELEYYFTFENFTKNFQDCLKKMNIGYNGDKTKINQNKSFAKHKMVSVVEKNLEGRWKDWFEEVYSQDITLYNQVKLGEIT